MGGPVWSGGGDHPFVYWVILSRKSWSRKEPNQNKIIRCSLVVGVTSCFVRFPKMNPSTDALIDVWDRRVLTAQLWDYSVIRPSLSWWAEMDVPCSAASSFVRSPWTFSGVVHFLHSCVLLTLVFRRLSGHRKRIVAMPSGRVPAWRKVYIHPKTTKLSFNRWHFVWPLCALGIVLLGSMLCYLRGPD